MFCSFNFLFALLSHFEDPKYLAVGCMDESIEEGKKVLRGRGIGRWEKGFLMHSKGSIDKNNTLWVSGGAVLLEKVFGKNYVGLILFTTRFNWEDIDLLIEHLNQAIKFVLNQKVLLFTSMKKEQSGVNLNHFIFKKLPIESVYFCLENITDMKFRFFTYFLVAYHLLLRYVGAIGHFFIGFFRHFRTFTNSGMLENKH